MAQESCALGVEIGGTVLRMGIVTPEGKILRSYRGESASLRDQTSAARVLRARIDAFLSDSNVSLSDCAGIGIGAAGLVDNERRMMVLASNLGWRDFRLGDELEDMMGTLVLMDKDTNMAALGELFAGSGKDLDSFIYATLGTGVGGAVVYGRKLLRGIGNRAGEFGHVIAGGDQVCGCGSIGCLETIAGGMAIARRGREAGEAGSRIRDLVSGNLEDVTPLVVVRAADDGDPAAQDILSQAADAVGVALLNAIRMIYPQAVILGGSLGSVCRIFSLVKVYVEQHSVLPGTNLRPVRVLHPGLGDSAAVIGSALSVFELARS